MRMLNEIFRMYKLMVIASLFCICFLHLGSCFVLDFEDLETDGYGGSGHVRVSSQYANMGVTFNDPIAVDFSKGIVLLGFAHSGNNAIEQCYTGNCYKPIEMRFDPATYFIRIWAGYHTSNTGGFSKSKKIELIAYDARGIEISRSTAVLNPRVGPMPIQIPLEVRSSESNISLARVGFSSITSFPADNRGLALDDIEFLSDTESLWKPTIFSFGNSTADNIYLVNASEKFTIWGKNFSPERVRNKIVIQDNASNKLAEITPTNASTDNLEAFIPVNLAGNNYSAYIYVEGLGNSTPIRFMIAPINGSDIAEGFAQPVLGTYSSSTSTTRVPILLFSMATIALNEGDEGTKAEDLTEANKYFSDGNQKYKNGDYKKALNSYNTAISHFSESPTLWLCKGDTLTKLNRYDEAVQAYMQAINYAGQKTFIQALNNLAFAYNLAAKQKFNEYNNTCESLSCQEILNEKIVPKNCCKKKFNACTKPGGSI